MWSDYLIRYANEICFSASVFISVLFYFQYKKYETEAENEDSIENFLSN